HENFDAIAVLDTTAKRPTEVQQKNLWLMALFQLAAPGSITTTSYTIESSASPHEFFRVEERQLLPCVGHAEGPLDLHLGPVPLGYPGGHLRRQLVLGRQPAGQALAAQHTQLALRHVQPRGVLGRVVELQPPPQPPPLGR